MIARTYNEKSAAGAGSQFERRASPGASACTSIVSYWPTAAAMDGSWTPPAVERLQEK